METTKKATNSNANSAPGLTDKDKVYFIRHNNDKSNNVKIKNDIESMCNNKRIGIRFENKSWNKVWDKQKNEPSSTFFKTKRNRSYKPAVEMFNKLSADGGYVVAEYLSGRYPVNKYGIIVSRIAKVRQVLAKEYQVTLQLDKNFYHHLEYAKYPVLLAARPPIVTICEPKRNTYREFVNFVLTGNKPTLTADLLHPIAAEQMCVEYLREYGVKGDKLNYCTLRPGGNTAVFDICGVLDNGKDLFAQVKNGPIDGDDVTKLEFLCSNKPNSVCVIFSRNKRGSLNLKRNTHFFDVEDDIFAKFKEFNPAMLHKMTGF